MKQPEIHFHQTTTLTPEQYIAGLTDFGPGRSKVFGNSADEYLNVHHQGSSQADVTEGSKFQLLLLPRHRAQQRKASGNACTTTGPIPTT